MRKSRLTFVLAFIAAVLGAGCGGGDEARAQAGSRIFVIVMENKEYDQVIGSPDAPYMTSLARRYASATRMYGIRHPSLPNYFALTAGSTLGVRTNCTGCQQGATSIADQMEEAGVDWTAYMEGMPSACFKGAQSGVYVKRHNPFAYYRRVVDDPQRCARIVPGRQLERDLRDGGLPTFAWITPGQCNNTHDCDVRQGDRYLSRLVPRLLKAVGRDGYVVITYDEGSSDRGCCRLARGGRIPTIIAGPDVKRGAGLGRPYTLYSVLRLFEDSLALPRLRNAARVPSLNGAFKSGRPPGLS
jgi:hypothetical protein